MCNIHSIMIMGTVTNPNLGAAIRAQIEGKCVMTKLKSIDFSWVVLVVAGVVVFVSKFLQELLTTYAKKKRP